MQKQTKPKPLGLSMAKVILVVAIIVSLGAVLGVVGWVLTKQKCAVQNPPIAQKTDETADWKTYRNEEYGFEVKYPKDWNYVVNDYENQQLIGFCQGKCNGDGEGILTVGWNISLKEKYEAVKNLFKKNYNVTESIVYIDSVKGKLLTVESAGFSKSAFFEKNGYVNNFSMIAGKETLFDKMLSTFKFIEKDETADWQIYRSEEYGFELKYPEGWEVAKNIFSLEPSLVFCLSTLATDPDPEVVCKLKTGATKPQYEEGMIYLFAYDKDPKPNSPKYHYLGSATGKYYYLYSEGNESIVNQILSTFRFIEPVCSSAEISGYRAAEIKADLNGDNQEETIRAYQDSKGGCDQAKPVGVKVFSGTNGCLKEVFSSFPKIFSFVPGKFEEGNQLGNTKVLPNFWGDERNAVMIEDISYACGSGSSGILLFLNYQDGKYSIVEGPGLSGTGCLGWKYKFGGDNGAGKKIIVAEPEWAEDYSDYCCGCSSRARFTIYTWNGKSYTKTAVGATKNYYLSEGIDEILQKEPSVLE